MPRFGGFVEFRLRADSVESGNGGIAENANVKLFDSVIYFVAGIEIRLSALLAFLGPAYPKASAIGRKDRTVGQRQPEHRFDVARILRRVKGSFGGLYVRYVIRLRDIRGKDKECGRNGGKRD